MTDLSSPFDLPKAIAVVVLGAVGTWLLLPHRHGRIKARSSTVAGAALTGIALLILATLWTPPSPLLTGVFFYLFAFVALGAGVLTITSRDPVYSALWFAAVVLATSGLFLLSGAQFLAAGTIIVYAGAIIVTFLFVIMLAQREGRATYDRLARAPARATMTCFLLFWSLLYALLMVQHPHADPSAKLPRLVKGSELVPPGSEGSARTRSVVARSLTATNRLPEIDPAPASGRHVAGLGGTLYTDHLVTVELAGALLFVALIGALSIATPRPPIRPGQADPAAPAA